MKMHSGLVLWKHILGNHSKVDPTPISSKGVRNIEVKAGTYVKLSYFSDSHTGRSNEEPQNSSVSVSPLLTLIK